MDDIPDRADIKVTPPVIFSLYLAAGFLFAWASSLHVLPGILARGLGLSLLAAAAIVASSAIWALNRQGTPIHPHHGTTALVGEGPYRFTRNPIYLSLVAIYLGLALLLNSFWMVLLGIALAVTLHRSVVLAEERYLEDKFGEAYLAYKAKVNRWL